MNEHIDLDLDLDLANAERSIAYDALSEAQTEAARGRPDAARAALDRAMAAGSPLQVAIARVEWAFLEVEADRDEAAKELLREADKLLPRADDCDFLLRLASCWRTVGELELAARGYRRVLDVLAPPEPPRRAQWAGWDPPLKGIDRYLIALASYRLGELALEATPADRTAAKAYFDRAHELGDPNIGPFACLMLVTQLPERQTLQQNEQLLRVAISYDHPEASPEAGFRLACWLIDRGRLDKAREPLELVRDCGGHPGWAAKASAKLDELGEQLAEATAATQFKPRSGKPEHPPKQVLIVGAGTGGQYLWTSLQKFWGGRHEVVGFVDDNSYPGGIPGATKKRVLGAVDQLDWVLAEHPTDLVWLAMPTAPPRRKLQVALCCASRAVPLKILPNMHELALQANLIPQLREIRIDDVIGDREVSVNHYAASWLRGQRVMIVGAGAIGTQLARKAANSDADGLVIVDRDDDKLIELEDELKTARGFRRVRVRSGSAADPALLLEAAEENDCHVIIYTATEGWAGAGQDLRRQQRLLGGVADFVGGLPERAPSVNRLVWVSDANVAVANTPVRALGAVAEAIALSDRRPGAPIGCAIRIPTVYTAKSSIVSALARQTARGVPLRVPPPPARQRFIHDYEAAELILQAGEIARAGGVFAPTRGEDVSLTEIAERMLQLKGFMDRQETMIEEVEELATDEAPSSPGAATDVPDLISLGQSSMLPGLRDDVRALAADDPDSVLALARRIAPLDHEPAARPTPADQPLRD